MGMGGYVTVPGGMMARLRGVPLVLVNADAALLLSNKALAPIAQRVCFGFPANFGNAAGKAVVTGNPVRKEILDSGRSGACASATAQAPLRILVVGGSLGAKALNDNLPAALALIPEELRPQVTHQSGKKNIDALRAAYAQAGVQANVVDFIDDMARAYSRCRSGNLPRRRDHAVRTDRRRRRQRAGAAGRIDHQPSARQRAVDGQTERGHPYAANRNERPLAGDAA